MNDYNRLNYMDTGMQRLEEGNKITQWALLALLAHGIDGERHRRHEESKNRLNKPSYRTIRQNAP